MATVTAAGNGNWSAGGTWVGGNPPGVGDTAETSTFTVNIDQSITCVALQNTAGGTYTVSGAYTIAANIVASGAVGLTSSATSGTTATITGNVTGGSGAARYGVNNSSTGTLNITGVITGGSNASAYGIYNTSTGIVNVFIGPVTGGTSGTAIYNNSTGNINVGTAPSPVAVNGGTSSQLTYGIYNASSGTVTIYIWRGNP